MKINYRIVVCLICLLLFSALGLYLPRGPLTAAADGINQQKPKEGPNEEENQQRVKEILVEMDKRMNPNALLSVEMEVIDQDQRTKYLIDMKAKDNNQYLLLRYLSPPSWENTDILMLKEDIWIYDRNSDRFMQVPSSMAFGGTDIAHGDMMRLNISNHYEGEIIQEDHEAWIIALTSISRNVPYHGIELKINKEGYYPIYAKLFSKTQKHIKTVEYDKVMEANGNIKPMRYTFFSPYEPGKYSVVTILNEKLMEYPDEIFNIWAVRAALDEKY